MLRKIDWDSQVGRRLRLRDLHVFYTVAQLGSMAKAAGQLGVSAPTVSEVIADLEHGLGVRLLDRSPQGVAPTAYGRALLKRTLIVFDELKQSIRDIEFLADPTSGELKIGSADSIAATVLVDIIRHFSKQYPRVMLHVDSMPVPSPDYPQLRDRIYDLVTVRWPPPFHKDSPADDLDVQLLFDDPMIIATGIRSRWARRRKIDFADLVGAPWMLPADAWSYSVLAKAFRARGLRLPEVRLATMSVQLRVDLLSDGECVAMFPSSVATHYGLKVLPLGLPARPWGVAIATLKSRTLSPVVERFIACARDVAKSFTKAH